MVDAWLGEKIGSYLKERGISQTFLSAKTGIELRKLNMSINGRRRLSFSEYELICGALEVDTNYFIKPRSRRKEGRENYVGRTRKKEDTDGPEYPARRD